MMTIQSPENVEELIGLRHDAGERLDSLDPKMISFLGLSEEDLIKLMPTYRPDDTIKTKEDSNVDFRRLYFYYLKFDNVTGISCHEYFYDHSENLSDGDVLAKVDDFLKGPGKEVDIEDLAWGRPCVIAFALEPPSWSFFDSDKRGTLQFPTARVGSGSEMRTYHRNKTFYNCDVLESPNGKKVLRVHNFHYIAGGARPRPNGYSEKDYYKFDLYLRVKCGQSEVTVIVDPGGKNLGP